MTATIETITAIEDPVDRAEAAADLVRALDKQAGKHRLTRNHAMLHLIEEPYKWPKTTVCKHVGVSRTMFCGKDGVIASAPAQLRDIRDPDKTAVREHLLTLALMKQSDAARAVRDDTILSLLFQLKLPNHEVARITGENQVRIAQLRSKALG